MKFIFASVILLPTLVAAAGPRREARPELLRADFSRVLDVDRPLDIESVRELAAQDSPEASILTAALDPVFLEANRPQLEAWLGDPAAVRTLETKAQRVAANPALLAAVREAGTSAAPRAIEALHASLASVGRSMDGALQTAAATSVSPEPVSADETPDLEIRDLRRRFNDLQYSDERYGKMLGQLKAESGIDVPFNVSQTPVFLHESLIEKVVGAARDIVGQLTTPQYITASHRAIPEELKVRNEAPHPLFVQVDFGMAKNPETGRLEPKLVELQGFPSLYAFTTAAARAYQEAYGLDGDLKYLIGGHDEASFQELMRQAIVGRHDPKNVVLMEIDPDKQPTRIDFRLTEKMLGIKTVAIDAIEKRGRKLYYRDEKGRRVRIERIYNRVIFDELKRKPDVQPKFKLTDDLDVEWAGHPNWFLRMSKFSLPFLNHESAPKSVFLSDVDPAGLSEQEVARYVLKPLFSFGGNGVKIHPTKADLLEIPENERSNYILQERVDFQPFIETPFGLTKAEIRIMFIWLDDMAPVPVTIVTRLTRGLITGVVRHNGGIPWAGASATFYRP